MSAIDRYTAGSALQIPTWRKNSGWLPRYLAVVNSSYSFAFMITTCSFRSFGVLDNSWDPLSARCNSWILVYPCLLGRLRRSRFLLVGTGRTHRKEDSRRRMTRRVGCLKALNAIRPARISHLPVNCTSRSTSCQSFCCRLSMRCCRPRNQITLCFSTFN